MTRSRSFLLALTAISLSVLLCLLALEVFFRFLPVTTGMNAQAVTQEQPVAKFAPGQNYVWSDEWNFAIVNQGRVNNDGFVNDQDYDAADMRPLLAVIGDSYVEASMVPYAQTLQGRLAEKAAPDARVYSFAASGAPLSQYLVWARYARDTYKPKAMTFVIIANDFDESLPAYVLQQTFHQFVENDQGELELKLLNEFHPSWKRQVIKSSALARYVFFNLNAWITWGKIKQQLMRADTPAAQFVANTDASLDDTRVEQSKRAVDAFFRLLPDYSGLEPRHVAFVVDSARDWIYQGESAANKDNYFDVMRHYLMKVAQAKGYTVVDMDGIFQQDFAENNQRFEYPTDNHWNEQGHGVVADALADTAFFTRFTGR